MRLTEIEEDDGNNIGINATVLTLKLGNVSSTTRSYEKRSSVWENEENSTESSQPERSFVSKGVASNG
jgi:hypothetical protein